MRSSSVALSDVVVIGYGKQSKAALTSAITKVDSKDMAISPTGNPMSMLQGKVPGMEIRVNSGQPGADPQIIVRGGTTTAPESDSPMVIIDGVIRTMKDINYADIETIQVLKDAAATSLYGSKGAYGVILIETKRGETAKPKVSYSANFVVKTPPRLRDVLAGGAERALRIMQILGNDTSAYHGYNEIHKLQALSDSLNPYYNNNTDWQGVFYQTTYNQTHNLSSLVNLMRNLTIRSMQTIIRKKEL